MTNLTESNKLIIQKGIDHTIEPGYDIHIQKNGKIQTVYKDGSKPKKSLFGGTLVFAVKCFPIEYIIKDSCLHKDNKHSFYITIRLEIRVLNAELLIHTLREDPLQCFHNKISCLITDYVTSLDWEDIKDHKLFHDQTCELLDELFTRTNGDTTTYRTVIAEYGERFGLGASSFYITRELREDDEVLKIGKIEADHRIKIKKDALKTEREKKMVESQLDIDGIRKDHQILSNHKDIQAEASGTAFRAFLKKNIDKANSPEDLAFLIKESKIVHNASFKIEPDIGHPTLSIPQVSSTKYYGKLYEILRTVDQTLMDGDTINKLSAHILLLAGYILKGNNKGTLKAANKINNMQLSDSFLNRLNQDLKELRDNLKT
ncbi:MAG: hypothetical protein HEP71_30045 [Roseivirga sp.]|nr:hypothetical protein [Roseivirga sp.]